MSLTATRAVWIAGILRVVDGDFWSGTEVRRKSECKWNGMAGAWNGSKGRKGRMMRMQESPEDVGKFSQMKLPRGAVLRCAT